MPGTNEPKTVEICRPDSVAFGGRRGFLAGLSAVVGSVLCNTGTSEAAIFGSSKRTEIPEAWVRRFGNDVIAYGRYIDKLGLKFVDTKQVIAPQLKRKGSIYNSLPPKRQWRNMRNTLIVLDTMSKYMRRGPKEIISAYRSPRYNAACPGAKRRSMHLQNNALDIKFAYPPYTVAKVAKSLRDRGMYKGGVGRYSSFTHIDTRGHNATW